MQLHGRALLRLLEKDGNIFITPSMQQALLEFDIKTKSSYPRDAGGLLPPTIAWTTRIGCGSPWRCHQVAMFDRTSKDLENRLRPAGAGVKEWFHPQVPACPVQYRPGKPSKPVAGSRALALPMPWHRYHPDGKVWVACLYANDLAMIDPGPMRSP